MERPTITLNGIPTLSGSLFEHRVGAWRIQAEIDADKVPEGIATVDFYGELQFKGYIQQDHSEAYQRKTVVTVVGGATGNLNRRSLGARHFRGVSVQTLLRDIAVTLGETLSDTIPQSVLDHQVPFWGRPMCLPHNALSEIADEVGASWRVLPDGTIWMGPETWPEVKFPHVEVEWQHGENSIVIEPDQVPPKVRPGTKFRGEQVSDVVTTWDQSSLLQSVRFVTAGLRNQGRALADIDDNFLAARGTQLDFSALYPCKVLSQSSDLNTADVMPDDAKVKGTGLQRVPIKWSIPGIKATLKNGARCMLGWEAADPKRPYLEAFEYSGISSLEIATENGATVNITTSGLGTTNVESGNRVNVRGAEVVLNDGSQPLARVGDLVAVNIGPMQAFVTTPGTPAPVVPTAVPPPEITPDDLLDPGSLILEIAEKYGLMKVPAVGQIISGRTTVKA